MAAAEAPSRYVTSMSPAEEGQFTDALLAIGLEVVLEGASGRVEETTCAHRARWWKCRLKVFLDPVDVPAARCRVTVLVWRSGWYLRWGRSTCPSGLLPVNDFSSPALIPSGPRLARKLAALSGIRRPASSPTLY